MLADPCVRRENRPSGAVEKVETTGKLGIAVETISRRINILCQFQPNFGDSGLFQQPPSEGFLVRLTPGTRFRGVCLVRPRGSPPRPPRDSFFERRLRVRIALWMPRARPAACDSPSAARYLPAVCACTSTPKAPAIRRCKSCLRQRTTPSLAGSGPASTQAPRSAIWAGARRGTRTPFQRSDSPARPSALVRCPFVGETVPRTVS